MAAVFIADVARGRGDRLPLSKVQALADGRVHVGQHAVELGLADEVGTLQKTLDQLRAGSIFGKTRRGAA
jgi:ClpP class serine protease